MQDFTAAAAQGQRVDLPYLRRFSWHRARVVGGCRDSVGDCRLSVASPAVLSPGPGLRWE